MAIADLQYQMIDGHGDPNTSPAFAEAVEAFYPVAYKWRIRTTSAQLPASEPARPHSGRPSSPASKRIS